MRLGKYYMGFYDNDCASNYVRKKGTWERVAFVYDRAAGTQTIVVDGGVMIRCTGRGPFMGTDTVYLGGSWASDKVWKGKIKNVKIFDKAIPADKIDVILQRNEWNFLLLSLSYNAICM